MKHIVLFSKVKDNASSFYNVLGYTDNEHSKNRILIKIIMYEYWKVIVSSVGSIIAGNLIKCD